MAIPNAGEKTVPSTEQRHALLPALASSSSSRLQIFASFGHPTLVPFGQRFLWSAPWDPPLLNAAEEKALAQVLQWDPLPLPSASETVWAEQAFASTKPAKELTRTHAYIITVI